MADIVVKRVEGANVQEAFLIAPLKIGVIGRSRGTLTDNTAKQTRGGSDSDSFPTIDVNSVTIPNVRSVTNIHNNMVGHIDEYFYPNQHFVLKDDDGDLLNPSNLGVGGDDVTDININWSYAPALMPPSITKTTRASGTSTLVSGVYYYSVSVLDLNGRESTPGGESSAITIPAGDTYTVTLNWERVEYSTGYIVYQRVGSTIKQHTITDVTKDTLEFTDGGSSWTSTQPQTVNTTKIAPTTGDVSGYTVSFKYGLISYNTYQEFTTYDDVLTAHGIGSELANVARIYMQPEFNNAPVFATVVPNGTGPTVYQTAANEFSKYQVQFIVMLYAGSSDLTSFSQNWKPIYDLAASLSDPDTGQMECYAVTGLPYSDTTVVNNVGTFISGYQATGTNGKRGFIVVPDGFKVTAASWQLTDGTYSTDYTVTDPASIDITSTVLAGAAMAKYTSMEDIAEPLTEKDVAGFFFKKSPFTKTQITQLVNYGAMVVRNDSTVAVVQRSINMSLPILDIEDGELSICATEDWMRGDLRMAIKKYRGEKMITQNFRAATRTLTTKLEQYENEGVIAWFNRTSVVCKQDPSQKDKLIGYFEYMPIYPINQIQIVYDFTFTVL